MPVASTALSARHAPPIEQARAIAQALLDGFDKHYALFRECARAARRHFESGNWLAIQHVARDRIDFYDRRVQETAERIAREFRTAFLDGAGGDTLWEQVKLHYIGLLIDHKQPECAETFFNSVSVKILHRVYFHNRFIFVRPAISTEHIDAEPPSYKSYYPLQQGLRAALVDIVLDLEVRAAVRRFPARPDQRAARRSASASRGRSRWRPTTRSRCCPHRSSATRPPTWCGRVVNGIHTYPFVVPVKHDAGGRLYFDALLMGEAELAILFSANRAYFLVDMEVPSAYIGFLHAMLADKTAAELYTMVGLQKAGKNLFFRDFLHHLKHSRDKFIIAPGIKGLVMTVFTLPSYPYVFKVIRDRIAASKDTDRQRVKDKYMLVKHHDRVGRMTDILEYSDVAFPRERFADELIAELLARRAVGGRVRRRPRGRQAPVHRAADDRRSTCISSAPTTRERAHAMREYGDALKELAAVNIFAGDLLFKNFGVTRFGRVVFYDYDEIDYLTDCVFRRIPAPPPGYDEMSERRLVSGRPEGHLPGGVRDVPADRRRARGSASCTTTPSCSTPQWWQAMQREIRSGRLVEVLSYPEAVRFRRSRRQAFRPTRRGDPHARRCDPAPPRHPPRHRCGDRLRPRGLRHAEQGGRGSRAQHLRVLARRRAPGRCASTPTRPAC